MSARVSVMGFGVFGARFGVYGLGFERDLPYLVSQQLEPIAHVRGQLVWTLSERFFCDAMNAATQWRARCFSAELLMPVAKHFARQ